MEVSIVICTYNRAHLITRCIESVVSSVIAADIKAEIIVVNNASTDETVAVLQEYASKSTLPISVLYEQKKGTSSARNAGRRIAQGRLLISVDDDCCMDINYISDALKHDKETTTPTLRGGCVELGDPSDLPLTVKTSSNVERWSKNLNSAKYKDLTNVLLGCNICIRKIDADRIGPFDENLGIGSPIPAGEDTDYFFRAYTAGMTLEYVPNMKVYHYHGRKTKEAALKLIKGYIIGLGAVYAKHFFTEPNLCRSGYWMLRLAIKEIYVGKNLFMPEISFSYKHVIYYCIVGIFKYIRWPFMAH